MRIPSDSSRLVPYCHILTGRLSALVFHIDTYDILAETSMASGTKVIIVGAGIAGPVLAMFLKAKGYNPIIYERLHGITELGLGLLYACLPCYRLRACVHAMVTQVATEWVPHPVAHPRPRPDDHWEADRGTDCVLHSR